MEGIAASSSMAMPSGARRTRGQSSVRKKAMPKPIGQAMAMASRAVISVPDCGQGAVDRRDRVPFGRPDEADSECLERLTAAEEHDQEDGRQHDDNDAAGDEEADVEARVGEMRLACANQRLRWQRLARCGFHRHAPEHPERTSVIQS